MRVVLSVNHVTCTNFDSLECIQDINLCKTYICYTIHPASVVTCNCIKPSTAARASCSYTKFVSDGSELVCCLVKKLCHVWAAANGCRVSLCHSIYSVYGSWWDSCSVTAACSCRVGGCRVRVDTPVIVSHYSKLAFKKNVSSFFYSVSYSRVCVDDMVTELFSPSLSLFHQLF